MGVHDKEVYPEIKRLLGIPEDEPIFILRSTDKVAPKIVESAGINYSGAGCSREFIDGVYACGDEMREWQQAHPDAVKVPD